MTYSKTVGQMTWRGEQPAAFKAGLAEFPANYLKDPVGALSTLSSVYYSYATHRMRNDAKGNILRRAAVMTHIAWLVLRANKASDRMVREAGGPWNLTVNQLDVRQSVMRASRRFKAAEEAIKLALEKFDPASDKEHTRALLLLGRAELLERTGEQVGAITLRQQAMRLFAFIERDGEYRQLARICRHLEEHYSSLKHHGYDVAALREKREWATRMAEEKESRS